MVLTRLLFALVLFVLAYNTYNTWFVPRKSDEDLINSIFNIRKRIFNEYPVGHTKRDSHAKAPGTVKGRFTVLPDLPKEYQVGTLFSQPGKSYPCWFRLSNALFGKQGPDIVPDPRGFAIKFLDENDQPLGQDMVLLSLPRMPFGLAEHFETLAIARRAGTNLWFILDLLLSGRASDVYWQMTHGPTQVYNSLLDIPYWGVTPFSFGPDQIVKYKIVPTSKYTSPPADKNTKDEDFLTKRMKEHLSKAEATFDFYLIFRNNPDKQPIDDLSVEWDEKESVPVKVATLTIPMQDVDQEAPIGEALTFSVGNALPGHEGLGRVNRIRHGVYKKMQGARFTRDGRCPFGEHCSTEPAAPPSCDLTHRSYGEIMKHHQIGFRSANATMVAEDFDEDNEVVHVDVARKVLHYYRGKAEIESFFNWIFRRLGKNTLNVKTAKMTGWIGQFESESIDSGLLYATDTFYLYEGQIKMQTVITVEAEDKIKPDEASPATLVRTYPHDEPEIQYRTYEEVMKHHSVAFRAHDVESVGLDYTETSQVIHIDGTQHTTKSYVGVAEIRKFFKWLFSRLGDRQLTVKSAHVDGMLGKFESECPDAGLLYAADTFVLEKGMIMLQTVISVGSVGTCCDVE